MSRKTNITDPGYGSYQHFPKQTEKCNKKRKRSKKRENPNKNQSHYKHQEKKKKLQKRKKIPQDHDEPRTIGGRRDHKPSFPMFKWTSLFLSKTHKNEEWKMKWWGRFQDSKDLPTKEGDLGRWKKLLLRMFYLFSVRKFVFWIGKWIQTAL